LHKKDPVNNLVNVHDLTDIWRLKKQEMKQFTWRRKIGIEKSRIDLFLVHDTIVTLIHSCDIRPAQIKHTDHLAVSIKNKLGNERGPVYWKLNNSLLQDIYYVLYVILWNIPFFT